MTVLVERFFFQVHKPPTSVVHFSTQFLKPWRARGPSDLTHCPNGTTHRIFGSKMGLSTSSMIIDATQLRIAIRLVVHSNFCHFQHPFPLLCSSFIIILSNTIPRLTGSCKVI